MTDPSPAEDPTDGAADSQTKPRIGGRGDKAKLRYRLLTGQDSTAFCERVSDALADGYRLYGSPTLVFDPDQGTRVAAQAVILDD